MLLEVPRNNLKQRELMVQVMFETFNVPALFIAPTPAMSMYSHGRTSGLICGAGYSVSFSAPILDGLLVQHAVKRNFIAGRAIDNYICDKLMQ